MDPISTPPSHRGSNPQSQTKSASRLARITYSIIRSDENPANLSLDFSPNKPSPPTRPSTNSLPLQELLILSSSPLRRSRNRLADKLDAAEEVQDPAGSRRRTKKENLLGCASPRNNPRPRRRMETEDRDFVPAEEVGRARKRRNSGRSKKEKLCIVPAPAPSSTLSPDDDERDGGNLDHMGQMIADLVMWRDVAKSSLWFGFGCLCFLSSCFTRGVSFSIFSMVCQLGLLFLGASFCSNSISQSKGIDGRRCRLKLREEDFQRVIRILLPATNLAILKMQELFSGEPSVTLKVAPLLLLGAQYGHLFTIRRLFALGFFISFTLPKLYSWYSSQINQRAEHARWRVIEAWKSCSRKKMVTASVVAAFWNLSSLRTRIFTAFIALVLIRYCRQHTVLKSEEEEESKAEGEEKEEEQALVVVVAEKLNE